MQTNQIGPTHDKLVGQNSNKGGRMQINQIGSTHNKLGSSKCRDLNSRPSKSLTFEEVGQE